MSPDQFTRQAVGVPFVEHGRDFDGWDCWGLCVVAYREVLGVTIPDYTYATTRDHRHLAALFDDRRDSSRWSQVYRSSSLDIAIVFRRGRQIHAGLVMPGRKILHVEQGVETCLEPISAFRVEGYYRPAA